MITLLDYGAGNIRSIRNAIRKLGFEVRDVTSPEDIVTAERLVFPGVGNFGVVMNTLKNKNYIEPLVRRIQEDKATMGICVALQVFFAGSEESPEVPGLGILPGMVSRFTDENLAVPQIGWNTVKLQKNHPLFNAYQGERFYFVHSFKADISEEINDWILTTSQYGTPFVSAIAKGNVVATQFHPEKSGAAGLRLLHNFLAGNTTNSKQTLTTKTTEKPAEKQALARRIIACLDVRSNDAGDLVVTKGDQYDVREQGEVRNLGKPVALAKRYYEEGADEITFLNITGFRDFPLKDQPMLEVLQRTSENVFVPLTIGGGIRAFTDSEGQHHTALDVAARYFRSGADKISIGSEAVYAVEHYLDHGKQKDGRSAIEEISRVYGAQAVVISVDPRRIYLHHPDDSYHTVIKTQFPGPDGEQYCWYQCTVAGGRKGRDLDVVQLVTACEELGAGEILLNCIDRDGSNQGFDLELLEMVKNAVRIPVIASSGAGSAAHFCEVFTTTQVDAALAAGIFHRREVSVAEVKEAVSQAGIAVR